MEQDKLFRPRSPDFCTDNDLLHPDASLLVNSNPITAWEAGIPTSAIDCWDRISSPAT